HRRAHLTAIRKHSTVSSEAEASHGLNPAHEEPHAHRQRQGSIAERHAHTRARRKYRIANHRKEPGSITNYFIELIVCPQTSESQFRGEGVARAACGVSIEISGVAGQAEHERSSCRGHEVLLDQDGQLINWSGCPETADTDK